MTIIEILSVIRQKDESQNAKLVIQENKARQIFWKNKHCVRVRIMG